MNRSLAIPAACCLFAFLALRLGLSGASGRDANRVSVPTKSLAAATLRGHAAVPREKSDGVRLIPLSEVERSLAALSGEYIRPWKQQESSPRYLYSRVAPRPVPAISVDVQLAAAEDAESDGLAVGTIGVSKGMQFEAIPCVVDRHTGSTRLFAGGKWLTATEWISQAPLPN